MFHVPVAAPFLMLAGDVGRLIDCELYLVRRCSLHEKVFLVLGPLEIYGIGWMDGLQLAHKMEREPSLKGKLEILYETGSDVPGTNITLLGCALCSNIPESDAPAVLRKMLEFNRDAGIEMWDVAKHNSEHKRDLRWLLNAVNNPNASPSGASALKFSRASKHDRQIVVVTSFVPDLPCSLDPWHVDAP